jgi:exopolysaccharide biosynthesis polyprenyl glycosylphosphotransferase
MAAMRQAGLYKSGVHDRRSSEAAEVLAAVAIGAAAFAGVEWVARSKVAWPALEGLLLAATGVLAVRWRFSRWLKARRSTGQFLRPVVLVGTNEDAIGLWRLLTSEPELGYRVSAVAGEPPADAPWQGLPTCAEPKDIVGLAKRAGASGIVLVASALTTGATRLAIGEALDAGLNVQVWPGLAGFGARRLRLVSVSGVPLFYVEPHRVTRWQAAVKRAVDVVLSLAIGLVAAPLLLGVAVLIKVEDGGPVLYRSERAGRHGVPITVLKLRTMVPNASRLMSQVSGLNERTDGPLFKAANDPRVTKIGRFLRATSIDELPQLWNVLNGTMSLVGPRPALFSEVQEFDAEFHRRHQMRPGLTGLWQIEARDNPSFSAYRRLDLTYIDNWSLALDFNILATTFHSVAVRGLRLILPRARSMSGSRSSA